MERNQFTFYLSFFKAIQRIRKKSAQADAYRAICAYALYGILPQLEDMDDAAAIAVEVALPILDAANRKAMGGAKGRCLKDTQKNTETCFEVMDNKEKNKEKDKDKEKEKDKCERPCKEEDFLLFWDVYPKKVGKQQALAAFALVEQPVDRLIQAVQQQKLSGQWTRDNGSFIPNAATWLRQKRWEDELPVSLKEEIPKGATGELGQAELENIQRLLTQIEN